MLVPSVASAVAVGFHIPELPDSEAIRINGKQLADIFQAPCYTLHLHPALCTLYLALAGCTLCLVRTHVCRHAVRHALRTVGKLSSRQFCRVPTRLHPCTSHPAKLTIPKMHFQRKITRWSELANINPALSKTHDQIRVIVRKDKAGTCQIHSNL